LDKDKLGADTRKLEYDVDTLDEIQKICGTKDRLLQKDILHLISKRMVNAGIFLSTDLNQHKCRKIFYAVVEIFGEILVKYSHKEDAGLRFGKLGSFKISKIRERLGVFKGKEYILPSIKKINFKYSASMKKKLNPKAKAVDL
jgi:hypothetical protein